MFKLAILLLGAAVASCWSTTIPSDPVEDESNNNNNSNNNDTILTQGEKLWDELKTTWFTSPVLRWTEREFNEYALERTRPYQLALLFTSSTPACISARDEFEQTAAGYWGNLNRKRAVSSSSLFFVHMNLSTAVGVFRAFKITKVPFLVLIPVPGKDAALELGEPIPEAWIREHEDPLRFAPWLAARAKTEIPPNEPRVTLAESWTQFGFLAQVGLVFLLNAKKLRHKRGWMGVSFIVHVLSVSGMIFCVLRGAAPFGASKDHGFLFLYPDRQNQFLFEGVFVALVIGATGASAVAAHLFASGRDPVGEILEEDELQRMSESERRQYCNQHAGNSILVFLFGVVVLTFMFVRKAPWYRPSFLSGG
jgi:hypothetical protein